jgi:hypothetical protein
MTTKALPENQYQPVDLVVAKPVPLNYGIVLSITPTDPTFNIEVYRAPDNGAGAPDVGNAVLIESRLFAALLDTVADPLPNDYAKRFYRWRHTVDGGTAGAYTGWVWARPDFLPQTYGLLKTSALPLRSTPLADGQTSLAAQDATGQTAAADVFVPAANTVKVGTAATPGVLTKTLRIPYALAIPFVETTKFTVWVPPASLRTHDAGNVNHFYYAPAMLPKGVTITNFAARLYRAAGICIAEALLIQCADNETSATIATDTLAVNAAWTTVTAALSQLVGDEAYVIQVNLNDGGAGLSGDTRWMWCEITYTMPSYDKGI